MCLPFQHYLHFLCQFLKVTKEHAIVRQPLVFHFPVAAAAVFPFPFWVVVVVVEMVNNLVRWKKREESVKGSEFSAVVLVAEANLLLLLRHHFVEVWLELARWLAELEWSMVMAEVDKHDHYYQRLLIPILVMVPKKMVWATLIPSHDLIVQARALVAMALDPDRNDVSGTVEVN